MDVDALDGLWLRLPSEAQEGIDAELRRRHLVMAIKMLCDRTGPDSAPGLYAAQEFLAARLERLMAQGEVEPEPTYAVADLLAHARSIQASVVAIEAIWDGDTQGWFVELLAIVERPGQRHERFDEVALAWLRSGGDIRVFNGQVPPWPEATEAVEKGQALAAALTVPFHFASPSTPDDQSSRWWDNAP